MTDPTPPRQTTPGTPATTYDEPVFDEQGDCKHTAILAQCWDCNARMPYPASAPITVEALARLRRLLTDVSQAWHYTHHGDGSMLECDTDRCRSVIAALSASQAHTDLRSAQVEAG